jgi:uncharacterized protein YbaR (Trm112 family)
MAKKIRVVDVVNNEIENVDQDVSSNDEVIIDTNEVQQENDNNTENIADIEDLVDPNPKAKPKPKPRIRVKKQPLEIMPVVKEEPKEEAKEEPKEELKPEKVKKVIELVACPKCNKMMNAKSLRYTHEKNCKGEVIKTEELPVKRRATTPKPVKKDQEGESNTKVKTDAPEIPDSIKEEICRMIAKQQLKLKNKEDNLKKLTQNIA